MNVPLRPRQVWLPLAIGILSGLVAWLLGVVPSDAVLIGLLVVVGLVLPRLIGPPAEVGWPQSSDATAAGTWYDVRRLGTLLRQSNERRDVFPARIRPRLRVVAERRLARLGVGWDDPAARRLIGPDVHDLLAGPSLPPTAGDRAPLTVTELVLGRLDELPEQLADQRKGTG